MTLRSQATKRTDITLRPREDGHATIVGMPRARNTTVGPEADALDAAARARDEAEKLANDARLKVVKAMVAAIDAGMSIAEAARRAGYTREHASKLYGTAKRTPTAAELMAEGPAARKMAKGSRPVEE